MYKKVDKLIRKKANYPVRKVGKSKKMSWHFTNEEMSKTIHKKVLTSPIRKTTIRYHLKPTILVKIKV